MSAKTKESPIKMGREAERLLIQWINCEQSKDTQKHSWLTALLFHTASGKRDVTRAADDLEIGILIQIMLLSGVLYEPFEHP